MFYDYADATLSLEQSDVVAIALVGAALFEQYDEEPASANDPSYENLYPDLA